MAALKEDSEANAGPLDAKDLWLFVLDLAKNNLDCLPVFYPAFAEYIEKYPYTRELAPQEVLGLIEEIKSPGKTLQEKMDLSKPLICLAPFLSMSNCLRVIDCTFELVDLYMKENKDLPVDYLDEFAYFSSSESTEQIQREIYGFFKERIKQDEFRAAGLAMFAGVSSDFLISHNEEVKKFLRKQCLSFLESESEPEILKLPACYTLENQGDLLDLTPEESFHALKKYLTCNSEKLRLRAYKAAKWLVRYGLWDAEILRQFLAEFESYPPELYRQFFKLAGTFIEEDDDEEEDEHEDRDQPECCNELIRFVDAQLKKNPDPVLSGWLLDIAAGVGEWESELVSTRIQGLLDVAKSIIDSNAIEAFLNTGYFLGIIFDYELPNIKTIVRGMIPGLMRGCLDPERVLSQKFRLLLAEDIGFILGELTLSDTENGFVTSLFKLASETLEGTDVKEAMRACGVLTGLKNVLTNETAQRAFNSLIAWIVKTSDDARLELLTKTARKLLKRYDITFESCAPFTSGLIEGKLPAFNGIKPWIHPRPPEFPFELMCAIVRKFQAAAPIAIQIWDWAKNASPWALLPILDVVHTAITSERVASANFFEMAQLVLVRIKKVTIDNVDLICAGTNVLAAIYKADNNVLAHPEDYIEPFGELIDTLIADRNEHHEMHAHHEEEDEEEECHSCCEDCESKAMIVPPIMRFALDVYSTDAAVTINEDLFLKLFEFMPFAEEDGMVAVVEALNEVIGEDRFRFARKKVAVLYAEILTQNPTEEMFEFEADTENSMRMVVRNALAEFPSLAGDIDAACGNGTAASFMAPSQNAS